MDISNAWRKKTWIPAGTRIQGFVQGATTRDRAEVIDAQALLPNSNEIATLTVYRTKDQDDSRPRLICDDKEIDKIGARQYATLELTPGKHTCHSEHDSTLEIVAHAGEDYFLHLRPRSVFAGWELKPVDTAQGEDEIANLELVGKP
jgi:hypothetical protein